MNKKILTLGLVLAMAFAFNCKKDDDSDDDTTLFALLFLADQTSGKCATVSKSGTTYTATLTTVPKGGCSTSQTREVAIERSRTNLTRILAIYSRAGSVCDTVATGYTTTVNNSITSTQNSTEEAYAATVANQRSFSISNLVSESSATLTALGFDVANTTPGTTDQLFLNFAATIGAGVSSCASAVRALDQPFFDAVTAKTKVVSSTCVYGPNATNLNRCTSLNEQF
jgi:hypothetical protein